jgi:hypothetical protein
MTLYDESNQIEHWEDEPSGPFCPHCDSPMDWEECGLCDDEGFVGHDCGEDVCCCLDPEPNERCGQCGGKGGWWLCVNKACEAKQ